MLSNEITVNGIRFNHGTNGEYEFYAHTDHTGVLWQAWRHLHGQEQAGWYASVHQPGPGGVDATLNSLIHHREESAPAEFQDHVIHRYTETNTPLLDANSGFEPETFGEEVYARWKPILRGPWRFAFDEQRERGQVERMTQVLKAESPRRKRVYVLVGNEPVESCYERALKVIEWGGEPFCQFLKPLNWLGDVRDLKPRFDWTVRLGVDFCRYFNRHLWRSIPLAEYKMTKDTNLKNLAALCPPMLCEAIGYPGSARYVACYWTPCLRCDS